MRVKEVLAIGRKIGPENFSQYRNFIKTARNQSVEKAVFTDSTKDGTFFRKSSVSFF